MKDNCFNEFDPNALSVESALVSILGSVLNKKDYELIPLKKTYGTIPPVITFTASFTPTLFS